MIFRAAGTSAKLCINVRDTADQDPAIISVAWPGLEALSDERHPPQYSSTDRSAKVWVVPFQIFQAVHFHAVEPIPDTTRREYLIALWRKVA